MYVIKNKDDKVLFAENDLELLENTLPFVPDEDMAYIEETQEDWQLINGEYRIGGYTQEELAEMKRKERDEILKSTDIYMLPDFPITAEEKELYKQYRQYLRDVTKDVKFPDIDILTFEQWTAQNGKPV